MEGRGRELYDQRGAVIAALCALVATAAVRFSVGRDYPLWLDETWTGAISADRDIRTLWSDLLNDANAPLYYLASWLWAKVFGLSDPALRSLAAVFGLLAPMVALWAPLDRGARWTWCAMLGCWVEGLVYSQDARCYMLLLLLSVGAAVAFLRLLQSPSTSRAAWWCALSALAILTHYFAAFPALAQGAVYLAVHRRAALRTWPAALVLLPLVAWLAIHGPRVLSFGRSDVTWYVPMTRAMAWRAFQWVWGSPKAMLAVGVVVAAAAVRGPGRDPGRRAPWLLVLAAAAGAALILGLGGLRPSFTERYLCACVPGLLLAPVLICTDPRRRFRAAPLALIAAALLGVFAWARRHEMPFEHVYSFERASAWIAQARPNELVFVWDTRTAKVHAPASLARVGGFFFSRAKIPLALRPFAPAGSDPNAVLAQAASRPKVATLWVYSLLYPSTAARRWPPRPLEGHECRNFGQAWIGVYACRPLAQGLPGPLAVQSTTMSWRGARLAQL